MLTANTQTWLRLRLDDGRIVAYGVPSLTRPNVYHRTNGKQCDCKAGEAGRECCHVVAAALYIAVHKEPGANAPAPTSEPTRCEDCGVVVEAGTHLCCACFDAFIAAVSGEAASWRSR